jgi:hypothetical protein
LFKGHFFSPLGHLYTFIIFERKESVEHRGFRGASGISIASTSAEAEKGRRQSFFSESGDLTTFRQDGTLAAHKLFAS